MNTQKLTTSFFGHKVEVTLVTADDGDKCYASIPNSVVDLFSERMECGEREGSFENLPDDELNSGADGHALSGHWRIIEIDYRKIVRILTWKGECASHEALSEESFVRYFGNAAGGRYYKKWENQFRFDLCRMLASFEGNDSDGQRFCDMIAEEVRKYEQRRSEKQPDLYGRRE